MITLQQSYATPEGRSWVPETLESQSQRERPELAERVARAEQAEQAALAEQVEQACC